MVWTRPSISCAGKVKAVGYKIILHFSHYGNSSVRAHFCFNMIMLQYIKWHLYRTGFMPWELKNSTGLPRALVLIPSNIIGMNWNTN